MNAGSDWSSSRALLTLKPSRRQWTLNSTWAIQQTARNCAEQFSILSPGEKCESKKGMVEILSFSRGQTIWIADAHRNDGKRFVVHAEEKLTAFADLNWRFAITRRSMHFTKANWARFYRHRRDPDPVGDVSKAT